MMTDSIEVRPRYQDPDIRINIPAEQEKIDDIPPPPTKGLFTSMYENKIIVLIIIITIIIIGIIAYVIYRKDEPAEKPLPSLPQAPPLPRIGYPERMGGNPPPPEVPNVVPEKTETVEVPHVEPEKVNVPEVPVTTPEKVNDGVKTDDEIMQLMEDEPAETAEHVEPTEQAPTGKCTHILSSGRQCRNNISANNKCSKHLT
jgi:hypothetical protein